jgi:ADP-ribose pyrophosphatase YjhB (NUDIX family)
MTKTAVRREYPEGPIPGVGAVVFRERSASTDVLLVKRSNAPQAGSWSLPGGAIELGETAAEACVREVREETGLQVRTLGVVETFDIILRDDVGAVQFHYLIVDMLCEILGGDLCAAEDASAVEWADVNAVLVDGLFALTPRACTVIARALQMHKGQG